MQLIGEWADIMNSSMAVTRMAGIRAELNDTWFAWSGPPKGKPGNNTTAYYRIRSVLLVVATPVEEQYTTKSPLRSQ